MTTGPLRVLFRAAAGPRVGFGHLVRCRSLARALGVRTSVSIRGGPAATAAAAAGGWDVQTVSEEAALAAYAPQILVVDDPCRRHAAQWIGWGRRLGILTAAVHDLGLGYVASDLGVDGSIEPRSDMHGRRGDLAGPSYAILDPAVSAVWASRPVRTPDQVLIALGGGAHVHACAARLCRAIVERAPGADIRVAAGFSRGESRPVLDHGQWVVAPDGLAEQLATAAVAVVAGGVTLYEACALGTPAIATALTAAQHMTIRAFAARGAVVDGHRLDQGAPTVNRVAGEVSRLLGTPRLADRLKLAGRDLVDGRGAYRVADRLTGLYEAMRDGITNAA